MSVAALPPPSLQPRASMSSQRPGARPIMQPRPSGSAPTLASRPAVATHPQGIKAKPAVGSAPTPLVRRPSTASSTPRTPTASLPPAGGLAQAAPASGSKDTSSSSGKVFAKPSKEWVLPERAKPGRKVSVEEPDNKRQSQNRLSQRAHRARRTDYIQTLEERLRQYEADEIHSNVRLQEVARALKADNEKLKREVVSLRMDLNDLSTQRDAWESERSSYEALIGRLSGELNSARGGEDVQTHFVQHTATTTTRTSPHMPTLVPNAQRRPTTDCPICPDPDPDCPCQQTEDDLQHPPSLVRRPTGTLAALHLAVKAMAEQDPSHAPPGGSVNDGCGVCQDEDECLCRAVEEEEDVKPTIFPTPSPDFDIGGPADDGCGLCTSASFCACKANAGSSHSSASPAPVMGIATATTVVQTGYPTPPSTSAVPLRLGKSRSATERKPPIWSLDAVASTSATTSAADKAKADASCSGDPSNCDACRDDTFGKEFCSNLFEKPEAPEGKAPFKPCADCPGNCMSIKNLLSPGSPENAMNGNGHAHLPAADIEDIPPNSSRAPSRTGSHSNSHADTMTCDQAWKALKAHPNSGFASLSLLADVVAGRTVCTGPQQVPSSACASPVAAAGSPAPGTATQSPAPPSSAPNSNAGNAGNGSAARKRNMAVETSAVRDALRLLDKATASPSPALRPVRPAEGVDSGIEMREVKRRKLEPLAPRA